MKPTVHLASGEPCEATMVVGEILHLISPVAFPPGAPVELRAGGVSLHAKSRGSKRRDDGRFDLRVRLVNLTRKMREQLGGLL